MSLLLLKHLCSDFSCLYQIKKRCFPIRKMRKFSIIFLKNLLLKLLHQINFISMLFISIIRVNIPKIKLICYLQHPPNKFFAIFFHISEALIYKEILIRDRFKDDVISGRMVRLTQDHISHLYQKITSHS